MLRHGQSEVNHQNIFGGWLDVHLTEKGHAQAKNSAHLIQQYCKNNASPLPQVGYTSRLVRTEETMRTMLKEFGTDGVFEIITGSMCPSKSYDSRFNVYQSWRLNERHYGCWQGQSKHKMLEKYGDEQYMFIRRDYEGKPPEADLSKEMEQGEDAVEGNDDSDYQFKEPNRHAKYSKEEFEHDILPNGESLHDVVLRLKPLLNDFILPNLKKYGDGLIVGHGSTVRSVLKILEGISDSDIKEVNIPNAIPIVIDLDDNFKFIRKFYLDPENARINAELVRNEGFR